MKTLKELKNGDCTVITDQGNFEGFFSSEYKSVYFAIPASYKILGYLQD